jgi:hypothetical protein
MDRDRIAQNLACVSGGGNGAKCIAYTGRPISKTISFEILPSRISKM